MADDVAIEDRVTALERRLIQVRSEICEARTEAAFANVRAIDARHALGRTERELRACATLLAEVTDRLPPDQSRERDRLQFAIQRLERVLDDVTVAGEE